MAISKEQLKKLMQRPELTSLEDIEVQPESIDDALAQKVESPDSEYDMPEEIPAMAEKVTAASDKNMAELPNKEYQADPEVAKLLMKLKAGNPADSLEDVEVAPETIEDTSAPTELRKMAIDKIKQKYLGR